MPLAHFRNIISGNPFWNPVSFPCEICGNEGTIYVKNSEKHHFCSTHRKEFIRKLKLEKIKEIKNLE